MDIRFRGNETEYMIAEQAVAFAASLVPVGKKYGPKLFEGIKNKASNIELQATLTKLGSLLSKETKSVTAEAPTLGEGVAEAVGEVAGVVGEGGYGQSSESLAYQGGTDSIQIGKEDLDGLRKKWNVPDTNTVAVGKTDIPELNKQIFEGGSPEVRKEAGLPSLDDIAPNRRIKAPYNHVENPKLAQFTRHAEEGVLNEFDESVMRAGLNSDDISGTFYIHQSNPRGICNKCTKGLINSFPENKCGIFYQASKKYPNITFVVTSEVDVNIETNGLTSFILKNGRIIE